MPPSNEGRRRRTIVRPEDDGGVGVASPCGDDGARRDADGGSNTKKSIRKHKKKRSSAVTLTSEVSAATDVEDGESASVVDPSGGNGHAEKDAAAEGDGAPKKRKRKRKKNKKATEVINTPPTESDAAQLQSVEHTVFIEGLPYTSTESEVRAFFATRGCEVLALRLPTWQDSGRLRGFGHAVFDSRETWRRALSGEVNGQELGGRYVTVTEARAPRAGTTAGAALGGRVRDQPEGCKIVYVRNLPYEATETEIHEAFAKCGNILEGGVRVARNHVNGQSKGFGYVEYKNEESALTAVQKAAKPFGLTVLKRPVFVDYDEGYMKGSFRDSQGKLWTKDHGDHRGAGGHGGGRGGGRGRGRGSGPGFEMRGARH